MHTAQASDALLTAASLTLPSPASPRISKPLTVVFHQGHVYFQDSPSEEKINGLQGEKGLSSQQGNITSGHPADLSTESRPPGWAPQQAAPTGSRHRRLWLHQ